MKDKQVIIRVPEPCNEDWNKMNPDEKGRFCASCATSVVDFSKMSDEELKVFLINNKGQKTCGHFKRTQLNRPISITIDLQKMPSNMNATNKFAMALFIVFGSLLFSCTDLNGNRVKEIKIEDNEEKSYVMGMMVMPPPPEFVADTIDKNEIPPPPPVMIGYEEGEMMGAVAYEYEIDDDTLTGDVVMVEEPNINPIDSCSFDGVEIVGFSPPLINNDSTLESPLVLGGLYVEDYFEKDNVKDSIENKNTSFSDQNLKLVTNWKVFPNPSNGLSTIQYYLQKQATVRLDVFDISGKHMKTLVNQANQHTGIYHIPFDGTNLPNGVYTISLIINDLQSAEKLIIEK
ncbi:MAG: T9SS type A sorting domain-containing protein [Sphingobacteriaceae bacterium]|jgi:hypothetical protein